eukprot:TRINITY_DN1657_c1_g1_i15.p2 TRINITY_DN1657_c1_g1~~TRINITY_DN1657_c1_g1_i15.p2  ORF type:complete len:195 (+),score=13.31 TRINITY_DN1657_c1_g1_i15:396-980(+)
MFLMVNNRHAKQQELVLIVLQLESAIHKKLASDFVVQSAQIENRLLFRLHMYYQHQHQHLHRFQMIRAPELPLARIARIKAQEPQRVDGALIVTSVSKVEDMTRTVIKAVNVIYISVTVTVTISITYAYSVTNTRSMCWNCNVPGFILIANIVLMKIVNIAMWRNGVALKLDVKKMMLVLMEHVSPKKHNAFLI